MEKHHSCLNTRAIIQYFQEHAPQQVPELLDDLGPEIQGLPNPYDFLMEPNNWVPSSVIIKMFENARRLTGDDQIAFKIGFEAVTRRKLGYVQRILLHVFGSPRRALRKAQAINNKFTINKTVEISFLKGPNVIIRLHWLRHIPGTKDFCLLNQGIYSAIPTIWNLPPGTLKETKCYFEGDDYCEFEGQWQKRSLWRWPFGRLWRPWRLLKETVEELEKDKELLRQKFDEVHHLNLLLKERIDQLLALPETCVAALSAVDLHGLLQVTLRILKNFAKMDRAGIFLLDEENKVLELHSGVGIDPALEEKVKGYKIPIAKVDNIIARVAVNGIPVVVADVAHSRLNKENPLLQLFKPRSFILAPISVRGKVIGVILADRTQENVPITDLDKEFVVNFANQIAIVLDNAMLQRRLEISERRYRELVENAHEGIWMVDGLGVIKFVNRRMREILGYPELEGEKIFTFFERDDKKQLIGIFNQNRQGKAVQQELEAITKDRGPVPVIISSVPFMENGQFMGAFAMFNDISDIKRMEKQLVHQQKMEAIGAMAGGIGHSFNDLLANIMILTGLVLGNTSPGQPSYEELKQIEQELEKGAELTRQLLSFGQKRQFSSKPVDLNRLVDKTVKLLHFSGREMPLQKFLAEDLPPVEADQGQLEQVFTNLLVTARQNLPPAGEITLTSEEVILHEDFCQPYGRLPGRYVYLSLSYPEKEEPQESHNVIFEPFVPDGVAHAWGLDAGLGLTSVYAIIKNHKGIIQVDREAGISTTFHIYLPVSQKELETPERQPYRFVRGAGTLLLVDDEETVRYMGAKILEKLGYKVILAENGQQALSIYQAQKGHIDLVVLDMIMPGLSGREIYRRLKKIDPEVRVLIYSGHEMDEDVHLILEDGALGFIQKPYRVAELSQKISELLQGMAGREGEGQRGEGLPGARVA